MVCPWDVCFTPKADIGTQSRDVRFVPMGEGTSHVRSLRQRGLARSSTRSLRPSFCIYPPAFDDHPLYRRRGSLLDDVFELIRYVAVRGSPFELINNFSVKADVVGVSRLAQLPMQAFWKPQV